MEEAAAGTALLRWGLPREFLAAHHQQGHRANPSKLHEGTHDRRPCGWCKSSRGCVRQKGEHARMCVRFSFLGCRQVSVNKKLNFKPKKHKCTLGCVLSKSRRLQLECDRVYNTKTSIGCLACSTEPLTFNTNVSHEVLRENPSKNEHPRLATEHVTKRCVKLGGWRAVLCNNIDRRIDRGHIVSIKKRGSSSREYAGTTHLI